MRNYYHITFCLCSAFALTASLPASAQIDTANKENKIDSLLSNQKGLLGELAQALLADTVDEKEKGMQRADLPFRKYRNRIIRSIIIRPVDFGTSISDTTKRSPNGLTRLPRWLHYQTKPFVARNHLFFSEGEKLSPYLLGNNERYLRDLPFIEEAKIIARPLKGTKDSVDVLVLVKDVLSIGGSLSVRSGKGFGVSLKEDNFLGWGDRLELKTLYDRLRKQPFGYGLEYLKRNVMGTFIDANIGYLNFDSALNSNRTEESSAFVWFVKPLVNPYSVWTYALGTELHFTQNLFSPDSIYKSYWMYKYRTHDAWIGWNPNLKLMGSENEAQQLRFLFALRMMDQKFLKKPLLYSGQYYYSFADIFALLGTVSVYKQNFYKTQYIYGFGRKEDLPEGIEVKLTSGYTKKDNRKRTYLGLDVNLNYVTSEERFFNYTFAIGQSLYEKRVEDLNILVRVDYFSRLQQWRNNWKQRIFVNASIAKQINPSMDEPLLMESDYGLRNYNNNRIPGHTRITLKAESVFFSPWSLLSFKFAPFVFGSTSLFETALHGTYLFHAFGGGMRTRNESLIFGTLELKAIYFPESDFDRNRFVINLSSNLRFKYNQDFIKRPEFVQVN